MSEPFPNYAHAVLIGKEKRKLTITKSRYGRSGKVTITRQFVQFHQDEAIVSSYSGTIRQLTEIELNLYIPLVFR